MNSGNQDFMLDNLRWIADYFVKCHHAPQAFTAQVGSTNADHAIWGRAEDMTIPRPSADLTLSAPGIFAFSISSRCNFYISEAV